MADNYTQLCVLLETEDERKLSEVLDIVDRLEDMGEEESNSLVDSFITVRNSLEDFGNLADIQQTHKGIFLTSETSCNLEATALVLQILLKNQAIKPNHPKGVLVTWAETCSKMRSEEFGGGAFLVTTSKVYWMPDPSAWALSVKVGE